MAAINIDKDKLREKRKKAKATQSTQQAQPQQRKSIVSENKYAIWNPKFSKALRDKFNDKDKLNAIFSTYLTENKDMFNEVEEYQRLVKGKKNIYTRDWTENKLYKDFKERNKWFFDENPGWNPESKKDVEKFQKAYNKKAIELGLPEYFAPKDSNSKFKVDGLFGINTYNVPALEKVIESKEAKGRMEQEVRPIKTGTDEPIAEHIPDAAPYWIQDLIDISGATGDYLRAKKRLPWQAEADVNLPTPTFYDPTRELAANAEIANIGANALATLGDPQSFGAIYSGIQGNALRNAADVMSRYNNMNVGVANQAEMNEAQILNQAAANKAVADTQLFDKTTVANQQYDNTKTALRKNIRDSFKNALTNRAYADNINQLYDNFFIDPATGGLMRRTGKANIEPDFTETDISKAIQNIRDKNPGMTYDQALKAYELQSKANSSPRMTEGQEMLEMIRAMSNGRRSK